MKTLIDSLSSQFRMKDKGSLHYFLGIQAISHPSGLFLHQTKYTEEILHKAGMSTCNPMLTPLPLKLNVMSNGDDLFPDPTYFRSLAGKLQYLTLTRPDIQFAVNFISQRMHAPTMQDFSLLKWTLRYLRGTSSLGLHLFKDNDMSLIAFYDKDWAGCQVTR